MPAPATDHDFSVQGFSARAALAEHSVLHLFGTRVLGVPGTLLARVQHPETRGRRKRATEWHYWWQAHFIDALVDGGFRALASGDTDAARASLRRGRAVLRGIQLRNFGSYPNDFYDDMAWLVLALERLNRLANAVEGDGDAFVQDAATRLYRQLTDACTGDLGGGAFWSKKRDFKNTPATAPIALAFARAGRFDEAVQLLNWLQASLADAQSGLYLDGVKITGGSVRAPETKLEEGLYTYNQGPVLGAYLALAGREEASGLHLDPLAHIAHLVDAIDARFGRDFTTSSAGAGKHAAPAPTETLRVLATSGGGDGGLFTGILVRYLAEVAAYPSVPNSTREKARTLVLATAALFWEGRREYDPDLPMNELGIDPTEIRGQAVALFSPNVEKHISEVIKPGQPVDLSTQLQAWMVFEAAARLS